MEDGDVQRGNIFFFGLEIQDQLFKVGGGGQVCFQGQDKIIINFLRKIILGSMKYVINKDLFDKIYLEITSY